MTRMLVPGALAMMLLAGCAPVETAPATETGAEAPQQSGDAVAEAAALIQQRYEFVRDGDYEGACALYSDEFFALFAELAEAEGQTCVEAHEKAALNAETYIATAEQQSRLPLTPFFYVPSEIEIDPSAITSDRADVAFLGEGTVVSLDPREFEDGTGLTPGWLAAQIYVMQGDDGQWRFIAPTEQ